jgi:2-polyprenyl-6-methoxyphenol hydroxylase-like FAD-dependent oxidoreductase
VKTTEEHQALIIGAGIGGLAAAIALRRAGYAVQVFERVQGLKEVGAGLTLWPNAIKVLRKLGLQAIIDEQSIPVAVGGIYTWKLTSIIVHRSTPLGQRLGDAAG